MFERNTYWILGSMTAVMCLWLTVSIQGAMPSDVGTEGWVAWVGGATPTTLTEQPYRLFTAPAAHLNAFHLLVNAALLWLAGLAVSRLNTPWVIPGCVIISGAAGTAATLGVYGGYALGASAGVFGLFGTLIWFLPAAERLTLWLTRMLVTGLVLALGALGGGDLIAHWSGFAVGVLFGIFHGL